MLRFIIERHEVDMNSGLDRRDFETLDLDIPRLEEILKRGGRRGDMGFESWQLLGVEIGPPEYEELMEMCDRFVKKARDHYGL